MYIAKPRPEMVLNVRREGFTCFRYHTHNQCGTKKIEEGYTPPPFALKCSQGSVYLFYLSPCTHTTLGEQNPRQDYCFNPKNLKHF